MIKLHEPLSSEVEINGITYPVDLSFDNILQYLEVMRDGDFERHEKVHIGLVLLLGEDNVVELIKRLELGLEELVEVLEGIYYGLILGDNEEEVEYDLTGNPMPTRRSSSEDTSTPTFDFLQDGDYIYSGFMQCYGIDLIELQGKLDWRKFIALLNGLSDDTKFKQVIDIRTAPLPTGKGTLEQRKALIEQKKRFALKDVDLDLDDEGLYQE